MLLLPQVPLDPPVEPHYHTTTYCCCCPAPLLLLLPYLLPLILPTPAMPQQQQQTPPLLLLLLPALLLPALLLPALLLPALLLPLRSSLLLLPAQAVAQCCCRPGCELPANLQLRSGAAAAGCCGGSSRARLPAKQTKQMKGGNDLSHLNAQARKAHTFLHNVVAG
jgi:hypothetical protein